MQEINTAIFSENLLLTQFYCDQQLQNREKNAASMFRSINPVYNGRHLFEFEISNYGYKPETNFYFSAEWTRDPIRDDESLGKELFEYQLLQKKERVGQSITFQKFQGEILVAEIDNTICDGASMVESEGFIDVYDCPPIDTWFYLSQNASGGRLLYAWVPKPFVYYVHGAIKVNCVDCLYWYGG